MDTGTKIYRNYFPIKFGWQSTCQYGRGYPVFRKLMYPGDVFKVHADLLIRYQPMLTPPMNDCVATVRFAFVPLRLVELNTELIVTGSVDGQLSNNVLPVMDSVFKNLDLSTHTGVEKNSMLDVMFGIPVGLQLNTPGLLAKLDASKSSPAAYFAKAFYRFWWDFYRDENLDTFFSDYATFETYYLSKLHFELPETVHLKKDRITSSLPWQLKATAIPHIEITGTGTMTPNYNFPLVTDTYQGVGLDPYYYMFGRKDSNPSSETGTVFYGSRDGTVPAALDGSTYADAINQKFLTQLNKQQTIQFANAGFSMAQIRELSAQTRIFERLARCGSRYTEYLKANFGVAPADDTLQRAQYLGGFKTRIVTTEVIQTAADGANPVGTLRGHGITHGTATIKPFMAKEIGVMVGILDIKPETIYAQGVDRELTARSRFDFLNPSFQHLSEQEVRKGEVYFSTDTDSSGNLINDETWGFQPYAQELRTGIKHVVGDMRDSLSYWNQSLIFSSRPSLNSVFISAASHQASYNRPFAVNGVNAYPLIVDFGGTIEAYRPLVKNGTPGLVDHN